MAGPPSFISAGAEPEWFEEAVGISEEEEAVPLAEFSPEAAHAVLAALALAAAAYAIFSLIQWWSRRRRQRIEAGNAALATLLAQRDHCAAAGSALRDGRPLPVASTAAFDPGKLSFLFDARGLPAVLRFIEAQRRYERLAALPAQAPVTGLTLDQRFYDETFAQLRGELVRRYGERFITSDGAAPPRRR